MAASWLGWNPSRGEGFDSYPGHTLTNICIQNCFEKKKTQEVVPAKIYWSLRGSWVSRLGNGSLIYYCQDITYLPSNTRSKSCKMEKAIWWEPRRWWWDDSEGLERDINQGPAQVCSGSLIPITRWSNVNYSEELGHNYLTGSMVVTVNTSAADDCLNRLSTAREKFKAYPTSGYNNVHGMDQAVDLTFFSSRRGLRAPPRTSPVLG